MCFLRTVAGFTLRDRKSDSEQKLHINLGLQNVLSGWNKAGPQRVTITAGRPIHKIWNNERIF